MTQEEVARHFVQLAEREQQLRAAGQKEYAHDTNNAFRNFEALGSMLQLPREKILWVYLQKHLDGILAYLNGHRSQRESVHGRVQDARVYLGLLDAMIQEQEALER